MEKRVGGRRNSAVFKNGCFSLLNLKPKLLLNPNLCRAVSRPPRRPSPSRLPPRRGGVLPSPKMAAGRGGAAAAGTAARANSGRRGAARRDGGAGAARAARGAAGGGGERREAAQHAAGARPCSGLSGSWSPGEGERGGSCGGTGRGAGPEGSGRAGSGAAPSRRSAGGMGGGGSGTGGGGAPVTVRSGRRANRGAGPPRAGTARGCPRGPPRP